MLPFKSGLSPDKQQVTLRRLGPIDQVIDYKEVGDQDTLNVLILDTETTGLTAEDEMVEIGIAAFRVTCSGLFTHYFKTKNWLNEPGRPMHPEAELVTGLSNEALKGHRFDDEAIEQVLQWSDIIIAHNARFDYQKMQMRYSAALKEKIWLCSLSQVDWLAHGHDSAKLSTLAYEHGFFFEKHRTDGDIHALAYLLSFEYEPGKTYLSDMLAFRDQAFQALAITKSPFNSKDEWRPRGYKWHPVKKVWWCLKTASEITEEQNFVDNDVKARYGKDIQYKVMDVPTWQCFDNDIIDRLL